MNQFATFSSDKYQGRVLSDADGWNFVVEGTVNTDQTELRYIAAAPPDFRLSYMGSGLPYATADMAYDNTRNKGTVALDSNKSFRITIVRPNAYYKDNGSVLVNPHVQFSVGKEMFDVQLGLPIANRSLSSLPGRPKRSTGR